MSGRRLFRDHDLMDLLPIVAVLAIVLAIVMVVVVLVMVFNAPEWSQQVVKVGDTTWLCLHNRTDIVGCETIKQTN